MSDKTAASKAKKSTKSIAKSKSSKSIPAAAPASVKSKAPPKTKPVAAAKPQVQAQPAPAQAPPPASDNGFMRDLGPLLLSPENRQALETLSMNLARAALTAQGAMAEAAIRKADQAKPMSSDPFNVGPAMSEVMGKLAAQPDRLMRAQADLFSRYMDLWQTTARRVAQGDSSEPVAAPHPGDRRFVDPEWDNNPLFDVIKQSYLLSSQWLNELVSSVEDVEPDTKRRAEFFMKMMTDAMSPSNFLISNPAALKAAVDSRGESLVKGMENFAADLERGGGSLQISQTDVSKFEVGVNVATAPGKVVFQNELIQLLQFEPTTDQVFDIPLVIFPPWINKYYILDLRPENSMIRWLASQGFTVFVVSWVNPDSTLAEKSFEDYLKHGVQAAVGAALKQTGAKQVNAVGYCIAGTLLSCALAYFAAKGDDSVGSATFFAAQQDFSDSGDLKLFTDEDWLRVIEVRMDDAGGVLPGRVMSDTFNALRANDLVWSFFVNNYLLGKDPRPFDLLFWNSDQTRMPKRLHIDYLRRFYQDNALAKGEFELGGLKLDLKMVKTPIFAQASREDHIAPYRSVYRGTQLFGGPVTYVMAGSGHIAGVINHPAAKKYQYWTNDRRPVNVEGWMAGAAEHPGSWWPTWVKWLNERSGAKVPRPRPRQGQAQADRGRAGQFRAREVVVRWGTRTKGACPQRTLPALEGGARSRPRDAGGFAGPGPDLQPRGPLGQRHATVSLDLVAARRQDVAGRTGAGVGGALDAPLEHHLKVAFVGGHRDRTVRALVDADRDLVQGDAVRRRAIAVQGSRLVAGEGGRADRVGLGRMSPVGHVGRDAGSQALRIGTQGLALHAQLSGARLIILGQLRLTRALGVVLLLTVHNLLRRRRGRLLRRLDLGGIGGGGLLHS